MSALEQMLCFSLYSASRATTQAYRRLLADWDLTYPQYLVLVALWDRGPLTVGELGDDLALDSGTLSPLLRRMEAAGLVSRAREQADARVVRVSLTERGEALRGELSGIPAALGECLGLSVEGAHELLAVLRRVTGAMQDANDRDAASLAASA
ncbi:MarR family winged helix-turn-helix transcriptional regulator [Microbacterium sp. SORGH_AS_0888]|uniref:MarR family winged helix-turn-helix transcriptional regulator n=1 Tax=Microbacterium sp. SORGH_AS_0888 TaxID=3041791 RepID=UPI002780321F|nr:MarR family transcriptional regulator [Microbacterium sp. SORGH_AS_0888]MDQ1129275.1 DNA-binding MarR family transcriptional regulator [Microbacterium sp. SORGH_AS_0888]